MYINIHIYIYIYIYDQYVRNQHVRNPGPRMLVTRTCWLRAHADCVITCWLRKHADCENVDCER